MESGLRKFWSGLSPKRDENQSTELDLVYQSNFLEEVGELLGHSENWADPMIWGLP